jgi:hypothetical protein
MVKSNPFTPKSGVEPKFFSGRENELNFFRKALDDTLMGRPSHFVVIGDWGTGKTSLLKEFKSIAQEQGTLCSLISVREFKENESLMDGIEYVVGEMAIRLPLDISKLKKFIKQLSSTGVSVVGTGFQFSKEVRRGDPQTFLYTNMLNLWKDVKRKTKALVVLFDDTQNFSTISEIFTILKNVLTDEKIVKDLRVLFVLSSTPEAWSKFLERHHPIGRYFNPRLKLTNLSEQESKLAVTRILLKTGVNFSEDLHPLIYQSTAGHPYELQLLCHHLYNNQIKGKVSKEVWPTSLRSTLEVIGEEVFDAKYERASEQEKQILDVIASSKNPLSWSQIQKNTKKKHGISGGTSGKLIQRLYEKRLIQKAAKGKYWILDPLFRVYMAQKF